MKAGFLWSRLFLIGYLVTYAFSSFAVTDKCSGNPGKSGTFASITRVQPPESATHPAILAGMELILEEHADHVALGSGPALPPSELSSAILSFSTN